MNLRRALAWAALALPLAAHAADCAAPYDFDTMLNDLDAAEQALQGKNYASLIQTGGNSIAANIANSFGEANDIGRGALIASGLVLFAITLVVNMTARAIIYRRREFRDSAA